MHITSVGIDLGKTTFHLVALDTRGQVVVKKKFSRPQLLVYMANLEATLVGMEACAGAHFIGAALRGQGHEVHLIPAQFVKPFLKSNKTSSMPRPLPKRWGGRTCASFRSRARTSSICKRCTECEIGWYTAGRGSSTRSVAFCWNAASASPKGRPNSASDWIAVAQNRRCSLLFRSSIRQTAQRRKGRCMPIHHLH